MLLAKTSGRRGVRAPTRVDGDRVEDALKGVGPVPSRFATLHRGGRGRVRREQAARDGRDATAGSHGHCGDRPAERLPGGPILVQKIRDFFTLFGRFEGEIAAAAATRRSDAQLTQMDAAWRRIEELEGLDQPEDRARGYRFLNRELHLVIHRMAHSRVMGDLSERM